MQALEGGLSALLEFLPKLLGFLLILVVGYVVAKLIAKIIAKVLQRSASIGRWKRAGPTFHRCGPTFRTHRLGPTVSSRDTTSAESVPDGLAAGILTYREGAVQFTPVQDAEGETVLAAGRAGLGAEPAQYVGADQAVLMLAEQIL